MVYLSVGSPSFVAPTARVRLRQTAGVWPYRQPARGPSTGPPATLSQRAVWACLRAHAPSRLTWFTCQCVEQVRLCVLALLSLACRLEWAAHARPPCAGTLGGHGRQGPRPPYLAVAALPPLRFRCLNLQRAADSVARLSGWVPALPVEALGGLPYCEPYPSPYPGLAPRRSPPSPSFRCMVYLPVHSAGSI